MPGLSTIDSHTILCNYIMLCSVHCNSVALIASTSPGYMVEIPGWQIRDCWSIFDIPVDKGMGSGQSRAIRSFTHNPAEMKQRDRMLLLNLLYKRWYSINLQGNLKLEPM